MEVYELPTTAANSAPPVTPTAEQKTRIFFPNLDGLRFFCFFSVFLFHSFATNYTDIKSTRFYNTVKYFIAGNGNLGVNFFFVLSGFLITYLLLAEKKNYHNIKVGSFYMRRILRIWPLFYFCVLFGFFAFPFIKSLMGEVPNENASIIYYLAFINNFDMLHKGLPDSSVLGILWSVAIEEQFYLVWPLLLYIFPSRYYPYLFSVILLISFAFRWVHSDSHMHLEIHTLSCISDMTTGGLFAYFSFNSSKFIQAIKQAPKIAWILLYSSVVAVFLYRAQIFDHNPFMIAANRLIVSILFALVILEQNYADHSLFKMSRLKTISKLGTYTYGLYCLYMIGILIAAKSLALLGWNKNVYQVIFLEGGLSLAITIVIAIISYHLFESRFLKLKDRFARITKS